MIAKNKNRLDIFLNEVTTIIKDRVLDQEEIWPLRPVQVLSYYEEVFAIEFWKRFYYLKNKNYTNKQLADLFNNGNMLVDALVNFMCMGPKIADKFNLFKTTFNNRENFFDDIFDIIALKDKNFLTGSGQRTYLSPPELSQIAKQGSLNINEKNRATINKFRASLFGLSWSYYYDLFPVFGNTTHGPYQITANGSKGVMLATEYYNMKPTSIWPKAKGSPIDQVKIYCFLKSSNDKLGILGRAKITENIGQKINAIIVLADGKKITKNSDFINLTTKIAAATAQQYKYVEDLTALQQVDKAIEMSFYAYKNFFGPSWKKYYQEAARNIKHFGKKFVNAKKQKAFGDLSASEIRKRLDPRNNYF